MELWESLVWEPQRSEFKTSSGVDEGWGGDGETLDGLVIRRGFLEEKAELTSEGEEAASQGTVESDYVSCLGHVQLFVAPGTVTQQAPLSMGFFRQEHWSGLPCLLQGIFPTQGLNLGLLHHRQILYHLSRLRNPAEDLSLDSPRSRPRDRDESTRRLF